LAGHRLSKLGDAELKDEVLQTLGFKGYKFFDK